MIAFYNVWAALGLVVYYFGPIDWPGSHTPAVGLYVSLCVIAFDLGVLLMVRNRPVGNSAVNRLLPSSVTRTRLLVAAYGAVSLLVLFVITGRSALDPNDYSLDFGQVYSDYGDALAARQVTPVQQGFMVVKAGLFPIALVAFVARFRTDRVVVALFLAPMLISSMFRGTDKELVDLVVLVVVAAALHGLLTRRMILVLTLVPVVLGLFLVRRLARFGGDLPPCLPKSVACFDYSSPVAQFFGARTEVLSIFLSNYLTNGYQGLSYAFDVGWEFGGGIGHLPPVARVLCSVAEPLCASGSYQEGLRSMGWDTSTRWTSVYPVLANDLSFWLVPLYLFLLGMVFSRCLSAWRAHQDAAGGAGIVLVTMFWVYSSANMQIAISLDWALATILFLYIAPWLRVRGETHVSVAI